jgi:LysR family transcriptional activator of nhaA
MRPQLNYRHLHYFWITAQEGSFTRAAERLGVAVQTISAQIGLLERSLGATLLSPQGRRLVPTEAGRIAMDFANRIFQLGERLRQTIEDSSGAQPLRLTVGISDALPKLIAYRLLADAPAQPEPVRLVCQEGDFDELIAELALHRLDVVLTDRPAAAGGNLRVYNHPLGDCEITLFGTPALAERYRPGFPDGLDGAPFLMPTRDNALRGRLEQWFSGRDLRPRVIGEFEDSALLMTFGRGGLGLFPAPAILKDDIAAEYGALPVGSLSDVREQFYAITAERRIRHPAIESLLAHAPRQALSGAPGQR